MKTLLITFALLASLPLGAQSLAGEYHLQKPEVASGLLLRPNGTFEYMFIYGAADYQSKGTWRSENGVVILDSTGNDEQPLRLIKRISGPASKELRVQVKAPNGRGVPHIDVGENFRTDSDGMAVVPRTKQVSIHVPVYDVHAGPFDVGPQDSELIFEINGDAITHRKFNGERLQVVKGGLQMMFEGTPLVYRKR